MKTSQTNQRPEKRKKRRAKSLSRRNIRSLLGIVPYIAPLMITAFIYTWQHTRVNIISLPIQQFRNEKRDLVKQIETLRLRIERLQAPDRIESIAHRKLGMVSPEKWQVIALDEPLQAPRTAVQISRRSRDVSQPGRIEAGLSGFLRKHGIFANIPAKHDSPEGSGQSVAINRSF